MTRILLLMMVLGTPLCTLAQSASPPAAEVLLLRLLDGLNNTDFDEVIGLFADDVLFWGTSTTTLGTDVGSAEEYFAGLRGQEPGKNIASALVHEVRHVSDECQLLSGTWKIDISESGTTLYLRTSITVEKRNDEWKIVQFHNSTLPQ